MKLYKKIINLTFILIIISCDSENPFISNDVSSVQYIADFQSENSGQKKYLTDVKWNKYNGENVLYELFDLNNDLLNSTNSKNDTTFSVNMDLNQIKSVSLFINNENYGSITIFSRPINAPSNLNIIATNDSNTISWLRSSDSDIQQTIIYRAELEPSNSIPLINDIGGIPDENIWSVVKQGNGSLSSYSDTSINTSFNYYYIVKIIDSEGGHRFSYIASNISGSVESVNINHEINLQSSEDNLNIGEIYSNKTYFTWQDYNGDDFYEYQIWKSEESNFDIDSETSSKLISITESNTNQFQDYNDVGQGKTWYYKIRIFNVYGNYIDSDIITCRTSL
tara:strand:+ start:2422 stop:3432 length:1011 start_codon:yes stop_codon:yes gene_type:complete